MANITITMEIENPTEGSARSGTAVVDENALITADDVNISWTFDTLTFTTVKQKQYSGSSLYYSTFRTQNTDTQFPSPQTGYSIDLWSQTLHNKFIGTSESWNTFTTGGSAQYNLNSDKYSLVYSYNNLYAPYYTKGGTVKFTKNT